MGIYGSLFLECFREDRLDFCPSGASTYTAECLCFSSKLPLLVVGKKRHKMWLIITSYHHYTKRQTYLKEGCGN